MVGLYSKEQRIHLCRICSILILVGILAPTLGCASQKLKPITVHPAEASAPSPSRAALVSKKEMPYRVDGKVYYPVKNASGFTQEGVASWYGPKFHGKLTSNNEVYNMHSMTAAHKTLPFNTKVRVTHMDSGREIVVRINDRGPFVNDRIIDLSHAAGEKLGMVEHGTARVRLEVLGGNKVQSGSRQPAGETNPSTYSVQVGIFKDPVNAQKKSETLPEGRILPVKKEGGNYYKVMVGQYPRFEDALKKMDAIRRQGETSAFIVMNP
jgi:rare lipoprotein A